MFSKKKGASWTYDTPSQTPIFLVHLTHIADTRHVTP